jgi:hypothetical protein
VLIVVVLVVVIKKLMILQKHFECILAQQWVTNVNTGGMYDREKG